jgi:thymidine phosphorylase
MSSLTRVLADVRDGTARSEDVAAFASAVGRGEIPDAEVGAFLMAVRLNGLDTASLAALTRAMADSGSTLTWDVPTADKHSTGGVGDKTSFIVAPLLAELCLFVPMISGRSLGHTGGTLDKLDAISGFVTDLSPTQMRHSLVEAGCFIAAASTDLAPADKVMYALRDRTSTVDSIPLIASSIVSKKLASGTRALVFDVKYGAAAFMRDPATAAELAVTMVRLAEANGVHADAVLSQMDTPLGSGIGNAIEVIEALEVLQGRGDHRLRSLSIELALRAARCAGVATTHAHLQQLLSSGAAYERFMNISRTQGATDPFEVAAPAYSISIRSTTGSACWWDALSVAAAASALGATRQSASSVPDPSASIRLHTPDGIWHSAASDVIATVSSNDYKRCERAVELMRQAIRTTEPPRSLVEREVFAPITGLLEGPTS